jgi:hypothetical protein
MLHLRAMKITAATVYEPDAICAFGRLSKPARG